jgi:hypothetical protein
MTDGKNFVRKWKTAAENSNEKKQAQAQLEISTKHQSPRVGLKPLAGAGKSAPAARSVGSETQVQKPQN